MDVDPGNVHSRLWNQTESPKPLATFYAIRHPVSNKYYKTYSKNVRAGWEEKLEDARLWIKLGSAKSRITALSTPGMVPELIEFHVTEVHVVDQRARVAEAKATKERKEAERQAALKADRVKQAEADLAAAQRRLEKLRRG